LLYNKYELEIFEKGMDIHFYPDHLQENLEKAGFIDVQVKQFHMKVGEWGDSISPDILG